jgi:DNA-binding winged helix-turn-helix (wHTH) protein/predicted ATPase
VQPASSILFPPFRRDLRNERLWRGTQELVLRPKTFAVLRCLVEHRDRLMTKEELLNALWPGIAVTDGALMACIRELRKTLGDNPHAPQFIETAHRRGYRFIAPVVSSQHPVVGSQQSEASSQRLTTGNWQLTTRPADQEALSSLTRGLEQLRVFPDLPERIQQEIALLLSVGKSLAATAGSAAPAVEQVFARAHALCRQVGDIPQLFPVLGGLQMFYAVRGELQTAREVAEQYLHLARRTQNPNVLLWAHFMLGLTVFHLGDLSAARTHLERGVAFSNPQQPCAPFSTAGAAAGCPCWLALALWVLGYPDQALQQISTALTHAQELEDPHTLAIALTSAAVLSVFRREVGKAQEQAEAALTIASEHGFAQWRGLAMVLHGWTLVEQGYGEAGIVQMRHGVAAYQATGAELSVPYQLALLAEACGKAGQIREGLNVVAKALTLVNKSGARFSEAELYRLKGKLTLQSTVQGPKSNVAGEAEACFRRAIEIACSQGAKTWELRATMSFCRLWQQQGKRADARRMLAAIYDWFTEGFDTVDLKEAKTLLETLG